ncbi:MAG: hypothetical protein J6Y92_09925, partial [Lentisphaeria bacterium]|nr:hypothetical protein [Lentisphaeria bacterium]
VDIGTPIFVVANSKIVPMPTFFNPISLVQHDYLPFFLSETVEEPKKSPGSFSGAGKILLS